MKRFSGRRSGRISLCLVSSAMAIVLAAPAFADTVGPQNRFEQIEKALQAQEMRLSDQERRLAEQAETLKTQQTQLQDLRAERDRLLDDIRAGRSQIAAQDGQLMARNDAPAPQVSSVTDVAPRPVGEAPPPERQVREVAALPERVTPITPLRTVPTIQRRTVRTNPPTLTTRITPITRPRITGTTVSFDGDPDEQNGALNTGEITASGGSYANFAGIQTNSQNTGIGSINQAATAVSANANISFGQ